MIVKHVGTKLAKRLARGDKGVNGLDELCKEHDIVYATHKDSLERREADKKLAAGALKRVFAKDSTLGERAASLLVTTVMKTKTGLSKIGMGISKKKKKYRRRTKESTKRISFVTLVKNAKAGIKKSKANTVGTAIVAALRAAKTCKKGKKVSVPRIIKVPNITGGVLPILPILVGLSAVGSLVGSASGVIKTLKGMKNAKAQLEENRRHNRAMEVKVGSGLKMGACKNGSGLYLKPFKKNFH